MLKAPTSTATIAIPARFKAIIDEAFGPGANAATINGAFQYLAMIVVILGIATAVRFYFVSWLGERVVGDLRYKVQSNLLRLPPSFFEANADRRSSLICSLLAGFVLRYSSLPSHACMPACLTRKFRFSPNDDPIGRL